VAEMLDRTAGIRQGGVGAPWWRRVHSTGGVSIRQFCAGSATSWGV